MQCRPKGLIMKKQVFLFELDSVRKTDDEIIVGQKTLYDEIVRNGNIVVLTYNQLIDSRAFFSLLNNKIHKSCYRKQYQYNVKNKQYTTKRCYVGICVSKIILSEQ